KTFEVAKIKAIEWIRARGGEEDKVSQDDARAGKEKEIVAGACRCRNSSAGASFHSTRCQMLGQRSRGYCHSYLENQRLLLLPTRYGEEL
ncbi:hypothetical protein Ancab_036700, partial [Ancistrocladus abbreviatus]